MELLSQKSVKAFCPSCRIEQNFIYISLKHIEDSLVYWECNCDNCNESKSGFSKIGFENI